MPHLLPACDSAYKRGSGQTLLSPCTWSKPRKGLITRRRSGHVCVCVCVTLAALWCHLSSAAAKCSSSSLIIKAVAFNVCNLCTWERLHRRFEANVHVPLFFLPWKLLQNKQTAQNIKMSYFSELVLSLAPSLPLALSFRVPLCLGFHVLQALLLYLH